MKFSVKNIKNIPQFTGIYKFYTGKKELLYIGKAINLKKRIKSYFSSSVKDERISQMVNLVSQIEVIPVVSEFEALLLEAKLIRKYIPKYNVIWKDDKHYIYIKITKETFPKVLIARKDSSDGYIYGPFPSTTIVREILKFLRNIFPYCNQNTSIKKSCFYSHINLCNPCPAEIVKTKGVEYLHKKRLYRSNIQNIKDILIGKTVKIKKIIYRNMKKASDEEKFEIAADYRNKLNNLNYLLNQYNPVGKYIENPNYLKTIYKNEAKSLLSYLTPYFPSLLEIKHIECFDISNISGKSATGSMVTFIGGKPEKKLYRRFKINLINKPNDFAMLSEILKRRFDHNEWEFPDLILIDGGKPQLQAILKILAIFKIDLPVIGLAKLYEEIVIPQNNKFIKLGLPPSSEALHLLQRIRDEAHRFAHNYYTKIHLREFMNL